MDDITIKKNILIGRDLINTIKYIIQSNYDINKIIKSDIFENTLFIWTIFNCVPGSSLMLLKYKKELKLDINKPSNFGFKLSPLIASILKGRYRQCNISYEHTTNKSLGFIIDILIDQPNINLKYITFYMDALKAGFVMFDYETIKHLITKDRSLFTPFHYYYYKFTYDLILSFNDRQFNTYIKNHYNIIYSIVGPTQKFTKEFILDNTLKIIDFINTIKHEYDRLYELEIIKWGNICKLLNYSKNINPLLYIGKTYESFTIISYDLLYLSIQKNNLEFTLFILNNRDKFDHSIFNKPYYTTNNPLKLCEDLLIQHKDKKLILILEHLKKEITLD